MILKLLFFIGVVKANVVLNEVANKGSRGVCDGEDWIEIYNTAESDVQLAGYKLCDDKGCDDTKSFTFSDVIIRAKAFMLLCKETDFEFGIGSGDTVSFFDASSVMIGTVYLEGSGVEDVTFSRVPDASGVFRRTDPTPGTFNSPLVLNEIASKGSDDACNGEDWIEIYNSADYTVSLSNHMLCDDKGCDDEDAYTFSENDELGPFEYKVLCKDADFLFGIGSSDIVTFLAPENIDIARVQLPGDLTKGVTYSRVMQQESWIFTKLPSSPGSANTVAVDSPQVPPYPLPPPNPPCPPPMPPPPQKLEVTCELLDTMYTDRCCESGIDNLPDIYTSFSPKNFATKCKDLKRQAKTKIESDSCCTDASVDLSGLDVRVDTIINPQDDAAFIYDDEHLHHFDIHLSPNDMEILDADPVAENYVSGNVTFMGQTYTNVGIRYKGSLGAWLFCVENSKLPNIFDVSGRRTCEKLSLKIAFDEYDESQRFYGLRKLLFHAMNNDGSYMKERIGYRLFREMGVPSPRANHVTVNINGRLGIYANIEYIDDIFTKTYFGDGGTGNLFKEVWPSTGPYQPVSAEYFRSGLRTNKGIATMDRVLKFVDDLAEDGRALEDYMRISHLTRFIAVDRLIGHDDGSLHFRCFRGEECENHNFYFYEESVDDRYWLIPWDLDVTFRTGQSNSILTILGDWKDLDYPCGPVFSMDVTSELQLSPSCDSLYRSVATHYMDAFQDAAEAVLKHPYYVNLESTIDTYLQQLQPALDVIGYSDKGGISGYRSIDDAIFDLKRSIESLKQSIFMTNSIPSVVYNSSCAEPPVLRPGITCKIAIEAVGCDYDVGGGMRLGDICIATCGNC